MSIKLHKALFLDRDGVVNVDHGYVYQSEKFEFIKGIFSTCKTFFDAGYKIIVVTNQSGIGRGFYSESDYQQLTAWYRRKLNEAGVAITDILHCPHHPDEQCSCRKPQPGLFMQAIENYAVDYSSSIMIGDKDTDIEAAKRAGIKQQFLVEPNTDNALLQCVLNNIVM